MDIISYFYYRGLLFTGLKQYHNAIDSFFQVLSLPTQITHKVHSEAYKKLLLLHLLVKNKLPNFPSYVP
jgi:hypothetical protein